MKKRGLSLVLAILMVVSVFSPAFPSFGGIIASAKETFPVELAFENLFIFEDWATNKLSTTIMSGVNNLGSVENINFENGSFRMTKKDMSQPEIYTAHGMSPDPALNKGYYTMTVEPETEYIFSYNVTGDIWYFTPFVFFFNADGSYNNLVSHGAQGYGVNNFSFKTPANVTSLQFRFTIGDNNDNHIPNVSSVYADIKDIAIYKADLYDAYFAPQEEALAAQKETQNLFDFSGWASKATSLPCGLGTSGTIEPDVSNESVKFTTRAVASDSFFTPLGIDTVASNVGFYTMTVSPNTNYSLTYDIGDNTLPGPVHCQPYIVELDASGKSLGFFNYETPGLTNNRKDFTTKPNTASIQLVFNIINDAQAVSRYCVVENIGIYKTDFLNNLPSINYNVDFATITGHPHRKAYSYTTGNVDNGTYGALPVPTNIPDGQVFAGWYTGKNGAGTHISSETEILPTSKTLYPKFEPAVDSLRIITNPTKLNYTLGEKVNPAGLVLEASRTYTTQIKDENGNVTGSEQVTDTFKITSGFRFSPKKATSIGTQNITVEYGGKTVSFAINVTAGNSVTIIANGQEFAATEANDEYILNFHPTAPFNRYEMTYYSDSYVKGEIVMDGDTEVFFLEPSDNGSFASYIDGFLRRVNHYNIDSIKFTCLDKEYGNFELKSVTTIGAPVPSSTTQYYQNDEYKVGISLDYGGVVSEIYDIENMTASDPVVVRVYTENGKDITRVDHRSILNRDFGTNYKAESTTVNLINTNDRGRYLQQSYYGTDQPPYEMGSYNGLPWSYNPVQGGNINHFDPTTGEVIKGGEASKVIDYRITADGGIYVKTRPLDWGKNSEDYPDSYVTDSYMEAWYTFDNGMIKTTCRFVDFSGYPSNTTTQEYPALYTIEPLNNYVYNDVAADQAWQTTNLKNIEEPDFWGILPEYNELLKANGMSAVDVDVDCYENWAAFTASKDAASFGIGVYSAGVSDFHYGVFPAVYDETQIKNGALNANYRHAASLDPAIEGPTSYISPVGTMTFESYKPSTYSFYVTTGNANKIREDFRGIGDMEAAEELAKTKVAVPETVYMTPANGASTVGQIYVNNILNKNNFYNVKTLAEREDGMYFGVHIADANYFTVDVSNATNPSNDINLCKTDGSSVSTSEQFKFDTTGTYETDNQYSLRFSGTGLQPGEKATAKWDITVTMEDGSTQKYTYYTVMYAPGRTVGAVAESRRRSQDNNETATWITGATSMVTDSNGNHLLTPIGGWEKGNPIKSGYFIQDPLVYPEKMTTPATPKTADDHITVTSNSSAYVMQTAVQSNDHSRAKSYLGLIAIDQSRYSNTNQIPNLKIGYDVLLVTDGRNDSLKVYKTKYALGTADSFNPSGSGDSNIQAFPDGGEWKTDGTLDTIRDWNDSPYATPFRQTVIPNYAVSSDMDGQYIHAASQALSNYLGDRTYGTSVTSVRIDVTDKSGLRDSVLTGYGVTNTDPKFDEALENAATVLGDPSATQEEIDAAKKELNDSMKEKVDVYYALKYDNLFSAYEFSQKSASMKTNEDAGVYRGTVTVNDDKSITVKTTVESNDVYNAYGNNVNYYMIDVKPNTEYVFEYDFETSNGSQAYLFFYKDNSDTLYQPTNLSREFTDLNGNKTTSTLEDGSYMNYYGGSDGHVVFRFKTNASANKMTMRFGNNSAVVGCTSTFSNIRFVEADKYYEDATYSKTEETFKEYSSYGAMITPVRPGYTFTGWNDVNGVAVTGADIATEHKTVYSQWNEHLYTIKFNANGGSGSIADKTVKYTENVQLPSTGFTNGNLAFIGWSTDANATTPTYQPGQTVSKLTATNNVTVTLYAVWAEVGPKNVTFDNLVDISAWSNSVGNGTIVSETVTDTGFTVKSNSDAGEAVCSSAYFPVEVGHKYVVEADIKGNNWDIYFFFCDANGNWVGFTDAGSRLASGGYNQTTDGIHVTSNVFTAPAGAVKAQLRVDANGSNNAVRFENIRVYDTANTTYLEVVNKVVEYGQAYGKLPVPVKEGSQFLGWVDEKGNTVTADSIMNSTSTVFLKSTWTVNANTVNDDTVVIEYGLPVVINVLSNDKATSVSGIGTKGVTDSNLGSTGYASSILTDKANTLTLSNGSVTLNGDGTITYTPSKTNVNAEDSFFYEAVVDGKYYYARVTVIPATTIYFEDTFFTFENSSVTKNGTTYNYNWEEVGTSVGEVFQTSDRPGQFNFRDDANNAYGYDSSFDSKVAYSGGTAHFVEVDQIAGTTAPTAVFTFTGTGFDLFTVTDDKSGTVTATIYRGTEIDSTKRVQGVMANAYFGYGYDSDIDEYVPTANGAIFQVPVIRAHELDYGTYTVVVMPRYNKSFDVLGTGKCGVYVDSVRIYDPMGDGSELANDAYKADGEFAPQFLEIRDTLVEPKGDGSYDISELGTGKSVFLDGGRTSMDDFAKLGPKNEVYLGYGNSVSFHIVTDSPVLPATVQLGMRLTGKNGSTATVKLMNTDYNSWVETITLNSTTERYYNIESVVDWVKQSDGTFKTAAPVVVTNTSDAIISLTSLKWAFDSDDSMLTALTLMSDMETPKLALAALQRVLNPEVTPQQTILNKENITFEFTGEPYALGDSGVLTITTEQGVSGVTVNGTDVFDCEINSDGKLEWIFEFDADTAGSMTFEIIARDEQGFTSESIYATTNVESDVEDGTDEPVIPDDGESDDNAGDSGNNNVVTGPESFVTTLLNGIFNIIRKILGLILGGATV